MAGDEKVSVKEFESESYTLRGQAQELPFLGPDAFKSLEDSNKMPKPITSWKIFGIFLSNGRDKGKFMAEMEDVGVKNSGGRTGKLFDAMKKKLDDHGLKLYIQLPPAMQESSQLTDSKRGAFLTKPYDNNPVSYLDFWSTGSQAKLNAYLKKENSTTDDLFALFLWCLPLDPSQEGCTKFDEFLEKELGLTVVTNRATVIDQMQTRFSVGFNYVADKPEEGAKAYRAWSRDANGRLVSLDAVTPSKDATAKAPERGAEDEEELSEAVKKLNFDNAK